MSCCRHRSVQVPVLALLLLKVQCTSATESASAGMWWRIGVHHSEGAELNIADCNARALAVSIHVVPCQYHHQYAYTSM